jgi:hypothetical protein
MGRGSADAGPAFFVRTSHVAVSPSGGGLVSSAPNRIIQVT